MSLSIWGPVLVICGASSSSDEIGPCVETEMLDSLEDPDDLWPWETKGRRVAPIFRQPSIECAENLASTCLRFLLLCCQLTQRMPSTGRKVHLTRSLRESLHGQSRFHTASGGLLDVPATVVRCQASLTWRMHGLTSLPALTGPWQAERFPRASGPD